MYLEPEDFKGYYNISLNTFDSVELQTYIDRLEPIILETLLGVELYALFVADLDANVVPQSQIYLDIYNKFSFDNNGIIRSNGMLEMMKGFIYYDYMRDSSFVSTVSGKIKNRYSNSEQARFIEYGLQERYNLAVSTAEAIQWYIYDNSDIYPTYNGINFNIQSWL